ncbi:MAG TPA: hypothetical protein P5081_23455 [Phycisphaerae bacterium]|nr:hypothetical protein [Phycisphaerae bacterium]HRW55840.1 hypothetical protein [Phycisphaerae bacterium]
MAPPPGDNEPPVIKYARRPRHGIPIPKSWMIPAIVFVLTSLIPIAIFFSVAWFARTC